MWIVDIVCSDPGCAVEHELVIAALDELELAICEDCGCCAVVVSVAGFEPVYAGA
jgi:hypothetical protein